VAGWISPDLSRCGKGDDAMIIAAARCPASVARRRREAKK
jgi:hypothetical protein